MITSPTNLRFSRASVGLCNRRWWIKKGAKDSMVHSPGAGVPAITTQLAVLKAGRLPHSNPPGLIEETSGECMPSGHKPPSLLGSCRALQSTA